MVDWKKESDAYRRRTRGEEPEGGHDASVGLETLGQKWPQTAGIGHGKEASRWTCTPPAHAPGIAEAKWRNQSKAEQVRALEVQRPAEAEDASFRPLIARPERC
ncbi:uncharacterized protein SEPMUDRAFT_162167 [Sphaerulina musiva SO2202]|uniref:Uncharacterized protein n=1 Tax=Sphaerulina musiva (strain SO2202) TaxID=692275 RepID=M3CR57_SPHMS|nr:uncharacterized protein SEPMUDRAFT_162167 [Sphaerulina musiva SO2202]EMF16153.1 hypothetical protein SEPMUDRAFT_162167 [Sphaerulina musiva SO2202]